MGGRVSTFTKMRAALPLPRLSVSLKRLLPDQVRFPTAALQFFDMLDRPGVSDLAREVGDGTGADVLMTPIRWLQRALIEAPMVAKDPAGEPIESLLVDLLAVPNPEYSRDVLIKGTVLSLALDGNAYWLIARNEAGRPVELWYAPHIAIEPAWPRDRADVFISHYNYKAGGRTVELAPEDVVHFRDGVDLENVRKGLSPMKGLLREVWTDNEAAVFTAALLRNGGIPGVVVSPADPDVTIEKGEAEAIEARIETKFGRGGRGRPLVMTAATKVEQFGFSPRELDLSPLRDVSEERVCAALGVQAAVVGFGAGLQQTKVGATMEALVRLAWHNAVIPMQGMIAGEVTRQLAPAFGVDEAAFDNNNVKALEENADAIARRSVELYRAGVITRAEARTMNGIGDNDAADEVYLVNVAAFGLLRKGQVGLSVPETPASVTAAERSLAGTNGNGKSADALKAADELGRLPRYRLTPQGVVVLTKQEEGDVAPARRVVIIGGPRRGKSTMARALREEGLPTFCTDPLTLVKDPEDGVTYLPEGLGWSEASKFVADNWLTQPGPWCVEGIATVRALRKFIAERDDAGAGEDLAGLEVIVLTDGHPDADINPRQEATAKAVWTIWSEIADRFEGAQIITTNEGATA